MKPIVKVVYDRKRKAPETGIGLVEVLVCLTRQEKTYIKLEEMSPEAWYSIDPEVDYAEELKKIRSAISKMEKNREEMCVEILNERLDRKTVRITRRNVRYKFFTDFMRDAIISNHENKESTKHRKMLTLEKIIKFGRIKRFSDVTPENLKRFDDWLHDGTREDISVHSYHKNFRQYTKLAYEMNYLREDPYTKVHFSRGKCKERNPLNEEEIERVRTLPLTGHLDRARDLFIFAVYTGLAYCDVIEFDFEKTTEHFDGMYYIDGRRIKTETNFFTPILPHALEILKKYNYHLPKMSNQKVNDYLRAVATMAGVNKKMTFHIARHTFATQALVQDIPIDKVARMLGHKDIKTTQVYAKVLKESVARHAELWACSLKKETPCKTEQRECSAQVQQEPEPQPVPKPEPKPVVTKPAAEEYYTYPYTQSFIYCYV